MLRAAVAAIMLVACSALGQTVTNVNSASGDLYEGVPITITGSGFGQDGPMILIFDDFEGGAIGTEISTAEGSAYYGEWDVLGPTYPEDTCAEYSGQYSFSGSQAFRADHSVTYESTPTNWVAAAFPPGVNEVYYSAWSFLPEGQQWPGETHVDQLNYKMVWLQGPGYGSVHSTGDQDIVLPTMLPSSALLVGNASPYQKWLTSIGEPYPEKGTWIYRSVYHKGSTGLDGVVQYSSGQSGNPITMWVDDQNVQTWYPEHSQERGYIRINGQGRYEPNCTPFWDDFYCAYGPNARARIEVGNNAVYAQCSVLSVMVPDSWSDTSITTRLRHAGIDINDSAYLFVVDADGNPSDGYPLSLANEELAIGGVHGAVLDGQTIDIVGTGFGVKSPAAPLIWDDFEGGIAGQSVSGWPESHLNAYSDVDAYSGSLSSANYFFDGAVQDLGLDYDTGDTEFTLAFGSFKWRIDSSFGSLEPHNIKLARFNSNDPDRTHGAPNFNIGNDRGYTFFDGIVSHGYTNQDWLNERIEESDYFYNDWNSMTWWAAISDPGVPNGRAGYSINSKRHEETNLLTYNNDLGHDGYRQILFGHYLSADGYPGWQYLDDCYGDTTLARVELGDASTIEACSFTEMQIPTEWSNGSITVEVNTGAFLPGDTAYLYVFDRDGNSSEGYPVIVNPEGIIISRVEGEVSEGQSITVSGVGFGYKPHAPPIKWETFEAGADSVEIASIQPEWQTHGPYPGGRYSSRQAYAGNLSFGNHVYDGRQGDFTTNWFEFGHTDTLYLTYNTRFENMTVGAPFNEDNTDYVNIKMSRLVTRDFVPIYGEDTLEGGLPSWYNGWGTFSLSACYPMYGSTPETYIHTTEDLDTGNFGRIPWSWSEWNRIEHYAILSDPYVANGQFWAGAVGYEKLTSGPRANRGEYYQYTNVWLGQVGVNWDMNPLRSTDYWSYMDNVYVDSSLCRIEIGNAPVYDDCTLREIQIPTEWSYTSVSADVNVGHFQPGDAAYVFIVDNSDTPSDGYPVTIGGSSGNPQAPGRPLNMRAEEN